MIRKAHAHAHCADYYNIIYILLKLSYLKLSSCPTWQWKPVSLFFNQFWLLFTRLLKNVHAANFLEDPKHSLMKSQTLRQFCVDALILIRAIFVWPWNDSARTKQKQPTNINIRKWFFYRTDRNARLLVGLTFPAERRILWKVIFHNLGRQKPSWEFLSFLTVSVPDFGHFSRFRENRFVAIEATSSTLYEYF